MHCAEKAPPASPVASKYLLGIQKSAEFQYKTDQKPKVNQKLRSAFKTAQDFNTKRISGQKGTLGRRRYASSLRFHSSAAADEPASAES